MCTARECLTSPPRGLTVELSKDVLAVKQMPCVRDALGISWPLRRIKRAERHPGISWLLKCVRRVERRPRHRLAVRHTGHRLAERRVRRALGRVSRAQRS